MIGYIIIGAIAGWIASMIMKTKLGILVDIVVGIVGALIGGFLLSFFVEYRQWRMVVHAVHRDPGSSDPALGPAFWSDRVTAYNGSAES